MMKHILLLILTILLSALNVRAQSLIVTSSGEPITGYEVTVTPHGIFYKATDSTDAQFLKLDSDKKVALVRHADGTIVNVAESSATQVVPTAVPSTPVASTIEVASDPNPDNYIDLPGATSSMSGGSTGASVNLGGVARAVGVGGAVGSLASAVNVGGSKSDYSTNVTYSQRVIAIPPRSTYKLEGKSYIDLLEVSISRVDKDFCITRVPGAQAKFVKREMDLKNVGI